MKLGDWIIISVTKACRTYSVACMTFGAYRQVHRRLLNDDSFGAGEPLNETAYGQGLVVKGQSLSKPCFNGLYCSLLQLIKFK